MSEKKEKSGFMETLKKIMMIMQVISILMAVISSAVFFLYPDYVTGFFFDFIGMPQMMSEEEILENPDEKIEKCRSSMISPDLCYIMLSSKLINKLPDKAMHACDQISDNDTRDNCYREIASKIYGKDVSKAREVCRRISGDKNRDHCYSEIARNLIDANPKEAIKSCKPISNKDMKGNCCREIASKIYEKDVAAAKESCKEMDDGRNRDDCFNEIAGNLKGVNFDEAIEFCKLIKNDYSKYDCLGDVWMNLPEIVRKDPTKSIELCELVKVRQDECFNNVARMLRSTNPGKAVEACDEMKDELDRNDCYNEVWLRFESTVTKNPRESIKLCGKLSTNQDECYGSIADILSVADKQNALKACEKMTRYDRKRDCKESIQR